VTGAILGLRDAETRYREERAERARPGLHHLALKARDRATVDELHAHLVSAGHTVLDPPAFYPQYGTPYYALFFADPDGTKLEVVHFPWGYWRRVQEQGSDTRPRAMPSEERRGR
jgi:catechol 2,3-dioxygenase-like lactoylglutathione lyase family enzyme